MKWKVFFLILLLLVPVVFAVRFPLIPQIPPTTNSTSSGGGGGNQTYSLPWGNITGNINDQIDLFANFVNFTWLNANYWTSSFTNSTGLIGLTCANNEILKFNAFGIVECATDSGGLSAIYSGNDYAYITGGDTVNVNETKLNDTFVPYNGATANVNLGEKNLTFEGGLICLDIDCNQTIGEVEGITYFGFR